MLKAVRRQVHAIVVIGVSAALVVGGVAAAQGGGGKSHSEAQGEGNHPGKAQGRPGGGPLAGALMKGLTYGVLHVQNKDGEAVVVRLDQGKVKSVDANSITLVENDESEVTIALDSDTKVIGKPGSELSVSDLKEGQKVLVCGPDGGTAKTIMLAPPKKAGKKGGMPGGPGGGHGPGADQMR